MLNTSYDEFNLEKFTFGLGMLTVIDDKRGNNHMEIVKDFIEFIEYDVSQHSLRSKNHMNTKIFNSLQEIRRGKK